MNDISSVLNYLGLEYNAPTNESAFIIGHSYVGAAAAALAMMNDTRLRGGVALDGWLDGGVVNAGLVFHGVHQYEGFMNSTSNWSIQRTVDDYNSVIG
jgi:pimeloyl-ACP methyl ester carboxylesterase